MRGRVLGLYFSTIGLNQLGGLGIGILATALGTPAALAIAIAGTIVLAGASSVVQRNPAKRGPQRQIVRDLERSR